MTDKIKSGYDWLFSRVGIFGIIAAVLIAMLLLSKIQCNTKPVQADQSPKQNVERVAERQQDGLQALKRQTDSLKKENAAIKAELKLTQSRLDYALKNKGGVAVVKNKLAEDRKDTAAFKESCLEMRLALEDAQAENASKDKAIEKMIENYDQLLYTAQAERDSAQVLAAELRKSFDAVQTKYEKTVSQLNRANARKDKQFVIGPSVGYGIGGTGQLQPIVGVSLTYRIIRF